MEKHETGQKSHRSAKKSQHRDQNLNTGEEYMLDEK
jgi:hypothetical protein